MGTFVIVQKSNGAFQFSLRADNGRAILISNEYSSKSSCEEGIEAARKYATEDACFNQLITSNGDFYFTLATANKEIIGSSDTHKSKIACNQDILSVKRFAPEAIVDRYAVDGYAV